MKIKTILSYFWKLPLCAIAFFIGMALGGVLLPLMGLQAPAIPEGTDANTIALWFLVGSIILSLPLSTLARNLTAKITGRWLILSTLTWMVGGVGMVLESVFFMETGAVSSINSTLFTMLNFLLPSVFVSGVVVWLFRPFENDFGQNNPLNLGKWGWKLLAALAAYPIVYITFGLLVQPFIMEYYTQGMYELVAPTYGQLIPLQLARSLLFLFVCLPVIRWWKGDRRSLWLSLGFSFFVLTAFMAVITAYWFPLEMRVFHGLELLADGMVYTGVLVWLFVKVDKK